MKTLNYGELPTPTEIVSACGGESYPMELTGKDIEIAVTVINQGIDSHLEAVFFNRFEAEYSHKLGLSIDKRSMHTFLRRLIEMWESGNDEAGDLASSILYTLNFEWV